MGSSKEGKLRIRHLVLVTMIGGISIGVAPNPEDEEMTIELVGGFGQYAWIEGCNEPEKAEFRETGFSIEKRMDKERSIGVRAHYLAGDFPTRNPVLGGDLILHETSIFAVNPYFRVDNARASAAFGLLMATDDLSCSGCTIGRFSPSIYLRVNTPAGYVDFDFFHSPALLSANQVSIGLVAFLPDSRANFRLGLGAGPYDEVGLTGMLELPVAPRLSVKPSVRFGASEGINETALSIGMSYRFLDSGSP